jgi:Secretion system C-terminal sorting domain
MKSIPQKVVKQLLLCSVFFVVFSASAQKATVTSGGDATGSNGSSSYSIGQVAYRNVTGTNGSINQGVQQPFEIFTLGNDEFPEIQLTMSVYPNPTASFVILNIQNYSLENVHFELFDLNGRLIQSQSITTSETQIDMEHLASAVYLLNVMEQNKILKTFKIIKNN